MNDKSKQQPAAQKGDKKDGKDQQELNTEPNEGVEEEVNEPLMAIDEFYPEGHIDKPIEDSSISRRNKRFFGCYGVPSYKRYNLHYLEDNVIIFATGNTYQIYNIDTHEKKIFRGNDTDGIGSISVHPTRKYFAVGEKGRSPNIYIYEYPSMRLYRILRKGTENLFSHIEFSASGAKLASIGGNPDYTITVWDWVAQKVVLKSKAFSQEVYRVSFSPYTDDILFTSGSGHIKFWRMAQTFTGLKLQGEIGKFGQLELSDVTGFAELPDGKIVSGSESGSLILWEGNLVKAHLVLDQKLKTPLHNGMIEVVYLDDDHFITAGGDGYIKWWKFSDIDNAEADEVLEVVIAPVKEKIIRDDSNKGEPAYIVNMIKGHNHWLITDGKGKIWKMMMDTMQVSEVTHFHSKRVQDLAINNNNAAITVGEDGQVKLWDFIKDRQFYSRRFIGRGTCCDSQPFSEANQGKAVAVGFDNGIVRVVLMGNQDFIILKAFKAHDSPIVKVRYSPDNTMFATASIDGEIFFFIISGQDNIQKYEPLCMIKIPDETEINDMRWDTLSTKLLIGCSNGIVYEYSRPRAQDIDNTETFLIDDLKYREWKIKMMEFQMKKNQKKDEEEEEKKRRMRLRGELPKEEEEQEEDWDPEPILACNYINDGQGRFIVSSQGQFSGFFYVCEFESLRPLQAFEMPKDTLCKYMDISPSGDFLMLGCDNGEIQIRLANLYASQKYLQIKMHDGHSGRITSFKLDKDEKFAITTGEDGLMYIHQIDKENIKREATFDPFADVENLEYVPEVTKDEIKQEKYKLFFEANPAYYAEIDRDKDGIDHAYLAQAVKLNEEVNEDIIDPTQYSIQQAKLRTEEDHRLKLAEEKKENVKERIKKLRKAFKELRVRNKSTEEWIQITEDDFNIDPVYFDTLKERNFLKIEEAKKEVAWSIEFYTVRLNKLKSKFYDVLEYEKFTVRALKTTSYVATFRVHKMSEFLSRNIEMFKQMLETELQGNNGSIDFGDEDLENLDGSNMNQTKDEQKGKDAAMTKTSLNQKGKNLQQAGIQKKTEAEKKREERKFQREGRKKKIEKLEKKEAMHSGEDPDDRKQIENAKLTYGDFKLKMSAHYIVPENQRVNFAKKRQQMVLLEGSIHKLKVDFNKKIQELKIRKREIIDRVKKLNGRLVDINIELNENNELFEPTIDEAVEYPEKFFEVKDQDIDLFRKQKLERERAAAQSKKSTNMMGGSKKKDAAVIEDQQQVGSQPQMSEAQKVAEAKAASDKASEEKKRNQGIERKGKKAQESELDEEMKQIRKIELQYERDQLTAEINALITNFDDEIKEMQKEKYRLESDLKNAEMKLILFFEELILLRSMESRDQELTKRLAKCRQDKGQILREINEISKKLRDKKKEIDDIKSREEELMVKFHELCPEGSDKYDEIRKYFEKIIKRRGKQKQHFDKEAGDGEDEDEGAEEEEEFEEEEEDDEDDNNVVGLPQEEYKIDDIEKLREDRMNLYDEKEKILQFINEQETSRKKLENQEKKIKSELEDTEEEIQDFQKEKMAKLNQLDVAVVLKVKQLQNLEPDYNMVEKWRAIREKELERKQIELQQHHGDETMDEQQRLALEEEDWRGYYLPKTLKDSILFTRTQLLQLINRKKELDEEQINLDKEFKDYKKDFNQKKKEIKENEKVRQAKEREYNERQMLRFGNLVDLDNLEISGPSNQVMELQNKFAKTEKKCIVLIEEADAELENTQRQLTQSIKENTNLLNLIRELGEQQLDLNRKLDSTNKAIFVDEDDEDKKNMMEEKQKLKKLLELQAKEIETLKTEINLYKKKGGHIYTKVTTNRRVANLNNQE